MNKPTDAAKPTANTLNVSQTEHGLTRVIATCQAGEAEIYTQGAHLARWRPAGHEEVLFLSELTALQPGKAIRGGIPIIFPWFGARTATARSTRTDGPAHGFARTSIWKQGSTAIDSEGIHLSFTLTPDDMSRSLGYDSFLLTYKLDIGAKLALNLTVQNQGKSAMQIEEALHTYLLVGDSREIKISGLSGTEYLDKTDSYKRKVQEEDLLVLAGETDRPYLNTTAAITVDDPTMKRRIIVEKQHSDTTVVWNPWAVLTAKMADMPPAGWTRMVCIESANAGENSIAIAPGQAHTMQTTISIEGY
jgi:glucose-6-phosphate 1-epimerase